MDLGINLLLKVAAGHRRHEVYVMVPGRTDLFGS